MISRGQIPRRISLNPWRGHDIGRKSKRSETPRGGQWTDAGLKKLLIGTHTPQYTGTFHDLVRLALVTGARLDELCSLKTATLITAMTAGGSPFPRARLKRQCARSRSTPAPRMSSNVGSEALTVSSSQASLLAVMMRSGPGTCPRRLAATHAGWTWVMNGGISTLCERPLLMQWRPPASPRALAHCSLATSARLSHLASTLRASASSCAMSSTSFATRLRSCGSLGARCGPKDHNAHRATATTYDETWQAPGRSIPIIIRVFRLRTIRT
jgi:hypothetical protein